MTQPRGHCILVFGAPGVGKTTACTAFSANHPNVIYRRASQLLGEVKGANAEDLRRASASEIASNQSLISTQLNILRNGRWEMPVLIDGHAVIDNDRSLIVVPIDAVSAMLPDALLLLEASPEVILARRLNDERRRPQRTLQQIDAEVMAERRAVVSYAETLGLPFRIDQVNNIYTMDQSIADLRRRISSAQDRT
jgi:adenylate kinase